MAPWTPARRARLVLVLVVALLLAGVAAGLLLVKPDLDAARDRADSRWGGVREALIARYDALGGVSKTLRDAGAGGRSVVQDLDEALTRWSALIDRNEADVAREATTANELEALARRARENVKASDRLNMNPLVVAAFATFDQAVVAEPARKAFNAAVRRYEDTRDGTFARVVAALLGYESRPTLLIG
jgi:hypothetical protein